MKVLGPSPIGYVSRKGFEQIKNILAVRGGDNIRIEDDVCLSDDAFFENYELWKTPKTRRMTEKELRELYSSKVKLSKKQELVKSVLDDCIATDASKSISE